VGGIASRIDLDLLARIEDASLNASAPPQQLWLDGWLVRLSPGKAQRARSINAVAVGRQSVERKLAHASAHYDAAGLPLIVRITPFSQPPDLDARLAGLGFVRASDSHVLVCPLDATAARPHGRVPPHDLLADGLRLRAVGPDEFAATVGGLRGSDPAQQAAHAQRLAHSPVPYRGFVVARPDVSAPVLCRGQYAREGALVGLYDVHTADAARGNGLARLLCERLLAKAASEGATTAYLQVDVANAPALTVYRRLGFVHGYGYHYRHAPAG
jgi:GNAT superfamily N-acetyltransferase